MITMTMYVTNDQPCTLIVGGVRINGGESKPIPPAWEDRCRQLAQLGAMRVTTDAGPVLKPAKDRVADLLEQLSAEERADLLAKLAPTVKADSKPTPEGAPEDFASWHVNRAKAWVGRCNDKDLLVQLGEAEQRNVVLSAIIDRVTVLDSLTEKTGT